MAKGVAIIGAGISGVAHADILTRCGFSVVRLERVLTLGGVWASPGQSGVPRILKSSQKCSQAH